MYENSILQNLNILYYLAKVTLATNPGSYKRTWDNSLVPDVNCTCACIVLVLIAVPDALPLIVLVPDAFPKTRKAYLLSEV